MPNVLRSLSPLALVSQDPHLTKLVEELQQAARSIQERPNQQHVLSFSRSHLERVRATFSQTIIEGEAKLHRFCDLLAHTFFGEQFELSSVVIGEVDASRERFTLVQKLAPAELARQTDLDLGNRQLERIRFHHEGHWSHSTLVANFVEYQPLEANRWGIQKLISRIKAEEEIWNKVLDEIFEVDSLVQQDKHLMELSRYIKDIFGIKILVSDEQAVRTLHDYLKARQWSSQEVSAAKVPAEESALGINFVEEKDYLRQKESGWSAIKSVVTWWDATLELQIQPLRNYLRERERLTSESHAGFKARRDVLRQKLSEAIPLYGFYRDLLRWLFLSPEESTPEFPSVRIELTA